MPQMSCARCGTAGADLSIAGKLFEGDDTQTASTVQPLAGPRFERQVERLHSIAPRPLGELLAEIATATGQPSLIADRVEAYAALDPEIVRALGADRFPPSVLGVVR